MASVAYNPDDPLEASFLAALGQGETGGNANAATEGVGGVNLSSNIAAGQVDAFGFPIWNGEGNSHAAGTFQFQPSTWDSIASEFDLNFSTPGDQAEGAWDLAQQTDPNLYSQLQSGDYSAIQSALASVWPSVTGNAAAPQGLAANLGGAVSTGQQIAANQTTANNESGGTGSGSGSAGSGGSSGGLSGLLSGFTGGVTQWALVGVGGIIVFVGLWMLLSNQGIVPSPAETGKAALAAI